MAPAIFHHRASPGFSDYFDDPDPMQEGPAIVRMREGPPRESLLPDGKTATDTGNAQRLVELFGNRVSYVEELGWMVYDGKRFTRDSLTIMEAYAKKAILGMYSSMATLGMEKEDRKKLTAWAEKTDNQGRIKAMIDSARSENGVSARPEDFDALPHLINTPNCVVDLNTGDVLEHDPSYFLTKTTAARYDNEAKCPRFEKFVSEIMAGDKELTTFLQTAVGYSVTGSTTEQVWFLLHGKGANGKSTFLKILERVLGDYYQSTDPSVFLQQKGGGPSPEVARLRGARFIAATEPEENRRLAESFIKQWTGGDTITARHLHREPVEFQPIGKIWLSSNHLPTIKSDSYAMWRRVRPIPFLVEFTDDAQRIAEGNGIHTRPMDRELENAIVEAEGPGVLAWIVRGAIQWKQGGLKAPAVVKDALDDYRRQMDPLADFLDDSCSLGPALTVTAKELYEAYSGWCRDSGSDPITKKGFALRLEAKGILRTKAGQRGYKGLRLTEKGKNHADEFLRLREARREDRIF